MRLGREGSPAQTVAEAHVQAESTEVSQGTWDVQKFEEITSRLIPLPFQIHSANRSPGPMKAGPGEATSGDIIRGTAGDMAEMRRARDTTICR